MSKLEKTQPLFFTSSAESLARNKLPSKEWSWVESSKTTLVARYKGEPSGYFFKAFYPRSRWEVIKSLFRGSRCQRAIRESKRLSQLGFNSPDVLSQGTANGLEWMITAGVNAIPYGDYLSSYLRKPVAKAQLRWKRKLITALAKLVGELHSTGIVHGDLRPNNVLVDAVSLEPQFFLIDNERNSFYANRVPDKLRRKNLVQINMLWPIDLTLSDRLRFFKSYATVLKLSKAQTLSDFRTVQDKVVHRLTEKKGQELTQLNLPRSQAVNILELSNG